MTETPEGLLDLTRSVALFPERAVQGWPTGRQPEGDPLVTGEGRSLLVPDGVDGPVVLVARAEDGTALAYWRVTVTAGETVSVA